MALQTFIENGLHIVLDVTHEGDVRLLHFAHEPFAPAQIDGKKQAIKPMSRSGGSIQSRRR